MTDDPIRLNPSRPRISDINPDVPSGMRWIAEHVNIGRITYSDLLAAWCQGAAAGRAERTSRQARIDVLERERGQLLLNAMGGLFTAEQQAYFDALTAAIDRLSGIPAPAAPTEEAQHGPLD